jgi:hypothetical protein
MAQALRALGVAEFVRLTLEKGALQVSALYDAYLAALGEDLNETFLEFARKTAEGEDLEYAAPAMVLEAQKHTAAVVQRLTDNAVDRIAEVVSAALAGSWTAARLVKALNRKLALSPPQERALERYAAELSRDPKASLRRAVRDRRYDAPLARGEIPSTTKRLRMVNRYAEKMARRRSIGAGRQLAIDLSHAAEEAVWKRAEDVAEVFDVRKFWIHRDDKDVRAAHWQIPDMNPAGRRLNEAFVTPLGELRYPCDPNGTTANIAGCRCGMVIEGRNPRRGS